MTPPVSLVLDPSKARYLTEGMGDVQGWLIPSTALYLAGLEAVQRGRTAGGICEIGVHRGKSFLAMAIDAPADDTALAIDVFDMQNLNEDGNSVKAKEAFENHLQEWGIRDRVEVVQGSSLELEAEGFVAAGRRFRLFSIDGGHGAKYVINDLKLAEATMVEGGVAAADDVFNTHWLGVCTGFFDYIYGGGTLRPFALIPNKLLLTDPASLEANRELMRATFERGISKKDVPFLDGVIDVYTDIDWSVAAADGVTAPLLRPLNDVATVRAELTGVRLDLTRTAQQLRRTQVSEAQLKKKLAAASKKQPPKKQAPPKPSKLAVMLVRELLPQPAKKPARRVYRKFRSVRRARAAAR